MTPVLPLTIANCWNTGLETTCFWYSAVVLCCRVVSYQSMARSSKSHGGQLVQLSMRHAEIAGVHQALSTFWAVRSYQIIQPFCGILCANHQQDAWWETCYEHICTSQSRPIRDPCHAKLPSLTSWPQPLERCRARPTFLAALSFAAWGRGSELTHIVWHAIIMYNQLMSATLGFHKMILKKNDLSRTLEW